MFWDATWKKPSPRPRTNSAWRSWQVVYILHGHGEKGVLKQKVRAWLQSERTLVKRFSSADQADGGDAFTRVELR
jgi:DNA-nicking Smr family endonuclease